jgi:hypothetical protein
MKWVIQNLSDSLTAISIIVAIFFGLLGLWWNIKSQKRAHTIDLISNFSTNSELSESDFQISSAASKQIEISGTKIDPELDRHIMKVLDYYEFLAVSYFDGALDKKTLVDLRGNAMKRSYDICRKYISDRQDSCGNEIYAHFEKLAKTLKEN